MIIRRAVPGDLGGLLSLYRELAAGRGTADPAGTEVSLPVFTEILADRSRHLLVADAGGVLAGTADLLIVANLTHQAKPWAIAENVVVSAAARRTGIGRALMTRLIGIARDAGCYKLQLHSAKHRVEAHAFYRSIGMDTISEGFKIYLED